MGWIRSGKGQLKDIPQYHNSNWPLFIKAVVDLGTYANENYTQTFSLKTGQAYQLNFDCAAF